MSLSLIITAAGIGVMATPHCVAMCACGLARSYFNSNQVNLSETKHNPPLVTSSYHLSTKHFLIKRLVSYSIGGALVGGASQTMIEWVWPILPMAHTLTIMLHIALAGMALLWLLQSTGLWHIPAREDATAKNTQSIKIRTNHSNTRFIGATQSCSPWLWAGVPCSVLYAAYALAYLTGHWLYGAILMFGFAATSTMGLIAYNQILIRVRLGKSFKTPHHQKSSIQWLSFFQAIILILGLMLHALVVLDWVTLPASLISLNIC